MHYAAPHLYLLSHNNNLHSLISYNPGAKALLNEANLSDNKLTFYVTQEDLELLDPVVGTAIQDLEAVGFDVEIKL